MTTVKKRLQSEGGPLAGFLNLIPSPVATQAIAAAGADVVLIDQEHGPVGPESTHAMIASTAGTSCSPWVRVGAHDPHLVKAALDAGAEGIVFPLVTDAASAAACVAMTTYPPEGTRGWGPFVAHARWNVGLSDYLDARGRETICALLIETSRAVDEIESICAVKGVDCIVIAPFDLSTDLGVPGQLHAAEVIQAVEHVERVATEAGVPMGGAALDPLQTRRMMEKGYRLLWHGFDVLALQQFVRDTADWRTAVD